MITHVVGVDDFRLKLAEVAHMIPKIVTVRFRYLSDDVKREIAKLCWGFVRVEGKTFDLQCREGVLREA